MSVSPLLWTGNYDCNSGSYPDFPRLECFLGACSIYFLGTNQLTAQWLVRTLSPASALSIPTFPVEN